MVANRLKKLMVINATGRCIILSARAILKGTSGIPINGLANESTNKTVALIVNIFIGFFENFPIRANTTAAIITGIMELIMTGTILMGWSFTSTSEGINPAVLKA